MYNTQNISGTYKILNGGRGSDNGLPLSSPSHFLPLLLLLPTILLLLLVEVEELLCPGKLMGSVWSVHSSIWGKDRNPFPSNAVLFLRQS